MSTHRAPALAVGEQVYRLIHSAIVDLTLMPAQRISELTLVKEMGVSRTPIREAIQRLEREGLVMVFPQRGTFVAPLDRQAIRAAYFTRLALERTVAGEAALRRSGDDLDRLRQALVEQRAVAEAEVFYTVDARQSRFFSLNEDFHRVLMEIADLAGVQTVVDNAKVHLERVRVAHLAYADPYPIAPLVEEHAAVVAALEAGDPAAADVAMRAHIDRVLPRLDLLMKKRPDFFELPRELGMPLGFARKPDPNDGD